MVQSKLPAFQFYPGDWMKDPALRAISPLARGVWIDLLCVMFESEKRGYLQMGGKALSEEQIARMVGCSRDEISLAMSELRDAGVFSTSANGIIYSRRIVRDEELRNIRSNCGSLGGNPSFEKGKPNPYYAKDKQNDKQADKQKITPSSSSSSSSSDSKAESKNVRTPIPSQASFDRFWDLYPKKKSKGDAEKAWKSINPPEELVEKIFESLKTAMTSRGWLDDAGKFIPYPASWLRKRCWEDVFDVGKSAPKTSTSDQIEINKKILELQGLSV